MRVCLHPLHARQHLHAWDVELRESDRRAQGKKRGKGKSFFTRERERERKVKAWESRYKVVADRLSYSYHEVKKLSRLHFC
ncbi:hypothetical protein GW17_00007695 [Ensete ventricosum]|nr:hypothetical protein GW17_00007695 [Ensete ventricosum]